MQQLEASTRDRAQRIASEHPDWPCRKGCDDCCRSLAAVPRVSEMEWHLIAVALESLPHEIFRQALTRIRESSRATRPVVCPLLDTSCGSCLVYEGRPIVCRAYGFYAEREYVLGCRRIEAMGCERPDVVWGNHNALEERLALLGPATALSEWLDSEPPVLDYGRGR